MKNSSMRGNLMALLALYGLSLIAAAGCPATNDSPREEQAAPPATKVANTEKVADTKKAGKRTPPATTGYGDQSKTNDGKPAFDPIKVNGRFFEGWEKPKLAILITGRQDGYLEPCGCAGLENQKGGLARRHALIKQLRADGWPLTAVDVGGLVRRFGPQAEIQYNITAEALKTMGYSAVGFGADDLRLPDTAIAATAANQDIFVSANVDVLELNPPFRIVEAGGMKLGITSVLGPEYQQQVNNPGIAMQKASEGLARVLPELAECDLKILLAHASIDESIELAKQFPDFDLVVTAGGADEPPAQPTKIEGTKAHLIEVGHKGMYAVVLGLYDDPQQPLRYQRVALDSRYSGTEEMKALLVNYQDQLQTMGWEALGLRPVAHPRAQDEHERAGQFVGASSCKECHPTAWGVWHNTKHAHATETLTKLHPPRQYDPECVSCHTTGWNPQEYFPYASGFESLDTTPHLAGNTCENCHGPGGAHVAAEKAKSPRHREAQREVMRLTKATAEQNVCRKCHDIDNSPEFDFEKYWPKVEHKGKR